MGCKQSVQIEQPTTPLLEITNIPESVAPFFNALTSGNKQLQSEIIYLLRQIFCPEIVSKHAYLITDVNERKSFLYGLERLIEHIKEYVYDTTSNSSFHIHTIKNLSDVGTAHCNGGRPSTLFFLTNDEVIPTTSEIDFMRTGHRLWKTHKDMQPYLVGPANIVIYDDTPKYKKHIYTGQTEKFTKVSKRFHHIQFSSEYVDVGMLYGKQIETIYQFLIESTQYKYD